MEEERARGGQLVVEHLYTALPGVDLALPQGN